MRGSEAQYLHLAARSHHSRSRPSYRFLLNNVPSPIKTDRGATGVRRRGGWETRARRFFNFSTDSVRMRREAWSDAHPSGRSAKLSPAVPPISACQPNCHGYDAINDLIRMKLHEEYNSVTKFKLTIVFYCYRI